VATESACCNMAASSSSGAGAEVAIGDKASQPSSFSFPNRKFGEKIPIYRSFQSSWFKKWPWLHYNQANNKAFCFVCLKASKSKMGNFKVCASKEEDGLYLVAKLIGKMLV